MKKYLFLSAFLCLVGFATVATAHDANPPTSKDVVVFFEIPVTDFNRAVVFYEEIMKIKLTIKTMPDYSMAFFEAPNGVGGALTKSAGYNPSADGTRVYLNGGDDLQQVLSRVEGAGGKIVLPKTLVSPEVGYIAHFLDTEGNRVGLYSLK